jgi:hypothetical protein
MQSLPTVPGPRKSNCAYRIGQSGGADRTMDGMMRGAERRHRMRACGLAGRAAMALIVTVLAAGCGATGPPAAPGTARGRGPAGGSGGVSCGTTKTAANVPVQVQVRYGKVTCDAAMAIERDYARAIKDGSAPGNGGGGPVKIDGWTCQGFATPVVLRTGQASKCVLSGTEILAILPTPA